ncbi:MAG: ATP-dependent zinc metalloprotease FtsH 4 [Candidatus Latescibacteria bacterium ADurb.Bin168]|nr:MAG: ATP-dependent zinc metalloprotease FtsH 4 [Candidatus Latescibacteria bacterium ADurb.Bin168]
MAFERRTQLSLWYFVGAFMILLALNLYFSKSQVEPLNYSVFRQYLKQGRIVEATLTTQHITGAMRTGASNSPLARFVTVRVTDPELLDLLTRHGVIFRGRVEDTWVTEMLAWIGGMAVFFVIWMFLIRRMGGPSSGMMSIGKSKAKIYVETETKVTFADVAGIDEAEEEVREVVEFLKEPERFRKLGGHIPKGVLLVGPPGTGKTLLARAVAGESGVPFFSLSGSDFVEMFVGVGAARVRDLFQQAKERAPCIIFIDELDALGKARGMNPLGSHDEREQTLNQLLVEMDGFDANVSIIIMAATNRPEILDMALLRPGRFDRQIVVDRPDLSGRLEILKIHAKRVKLDPEVDLRQLAAGTPGMVGADLANVVNEAALLAARRGHDAISQNDLQEAVERTLVGLEKKSRVLNERERTVVAYHEAGHALVGLCSPHATPVHRVTIIPRGVAALGYTMHLPTEDRYIQTKAELDAELGVVLGGRAAEEVVFNEISTGASNDFVQATRIASSMVKDYGMSRLGVVSYDDENQSRFLRQISGGMPQYGERTAAQIDREVRAIINDRYQHVKKLLSEKREQLEAVAQRLLATESISSEELRELVEGCGANKPAQEGPVSVQGEGVTSDATKEDA